MSLGVSLLVSIATANETLITECSRYAVDDRRLFRSRALVRVCARDTVHPDRGSLSLLGALAPLIGSFAGSEGNSITLVYVLVGAGAIALFAHSRF